MAKSTFTSLWAECTRRTNNPNLIKIAMIAWDFYSTWTGSVSKYTFISKFPLTFLRAVYLSAMTFSRRLTRFELSLYCVLSDPGYMILYTGSMWGAVSTPERYRLWNPSSPTRNFVKEVGLQQREICHVILFCLFY